MSGLYINSRTTCEGTSWACSLCTGHSCIYITSRAMHGQKSNVRWVPLAGSLGVSSRKPSARAIFCWTSHTERFCIACSDTPDRGCHREFTAADDICVWIRRSQWWHRCSKDAHSLFFLLRFSISEHVLGSGVAEHGVENVQQQVACSWLCLRATVHKVRTSEDLQRASAVKSDRCSHVRRPLHLTMKGFGL